MFYIVSLCLFVGMANKVFIKHCIAYILTLVVQCLPSMTLERAAVDSQYYFARKSDLTSTLTLYVTQ